MCRGWGPTPPAHCCSLPGAPLVLQAPIARVPWTAPPTPTPSGTLGLPQKCRILQGLLEAELLCRGMVGGERGNADSLFTAEGPLLA